MNYEEDELENLVSLLLESGERITFLDGALLLTKARRIDPLTEKAMALLLHVHDSEYVTIGLRRTLRSYFETIARVLAEERERATRILTFSDHNKVVRAVHGSKLEIELPERRGLGYRWKVAHSPPFLRVDPISHPDPSANKAAFQIQLKKPGPGAVVFEEEAPARTPGRMSQKTKDAKASKTKQFLVKIIVESRQ
ncbi:protease inhibitor I42 family protein [Myxococcota bacterium]|nr:protease inhibitor I42 family protein [Myxococcota bacterium]